MRKKLLAEQASEIILYDRTCEWGNFYEQKNFKFALIINWRAVIEMKAWGNEVEKKVDDEGKKDS